MAQPKARAKTRSSTSRSNASAKGRRRSASTGRSSTRANSSSSRGQSSRVRDAGGAIGRAAGRAKVPLIAGGTALAGAAGGLAVGMRRGRRRRRTDLAKAAKNVGALGAQMGHLAAELQQSRQMNGGDVHRSPLEVVLEGLTARRRRA